MHLIELKNLRKEYGENVILNDINLYVQEDEFLTLLGPSGCGKTTTLRIIAEPDPRDPAKQDSDRVAACEDYGNFDFDPIPKQDSDKVVADDADAHNFFGFHVARWTDVL